MFDFLKNRYQKIKNALSKTKSVLGKKIRNLFSKPLNEETLEQFEQILFEADLGSTVVSEFIDTIDHYHRKNPRATAEELINCLQEKSLEILHAPPSTEQKSPKEGKPLVILMVGINGSGKTTTAAKLGAYYQSLGKSVLLAAGDTFRAAAIDQLEIWSKRLNLQIVKGTMGADPSSVIYDALQSANAKGIDIVIADTAGRLDSKTDLMLELDKIHRVIQKFDPDAPHEVLLVVDATIGQNAMEQARTFNKYAPLTGIALSKLDGSAKGGIVLSIYREMGIPVKWVGVGETAEDLLAFDEENYVDALFSP